MNMLENGRCGNPADQVSRLDDCRLKPFRDPREILAPEWFVQSLLRQKLVTVLDCDIPAGAAEFSIALGVHLAAGKPLGGLAVDRPCRVLIVSLFPLAERDRDEFELRAWAACIAAGIDAGGVQYHLGFEVLEGRWIRAAGTGAIATAELLHAARAWREQEFDVVIVDPLHRTHEPGISPPAVLAAFATAAFEANISILLVDHGGDASISEHARVRARLAPDVEVEGGFLLDSEVRFDPVILRRIRLRSAIIDLGQRRETLAITPAL